jgi:hypothetical protein
MAMVKIKIVMRHAVCVQVKEEKKDERYVASHVDGNTCSPSTNSFIS